MSGNRERASGAFRIRNRLGLHARAAATMVRLSNEFESEILVGRPDMEVNGKSIMGLMLMAACKGTTLTVSAEGPDAEKAVEALGELIDAGFGEE